MNIKVYIKYFGNPATFDISDYVVSDITVPISTRERDYTLVTRGFDLELPFTFPFASGENWETIEEVYVNGDNINFSGTVKKREQDYNNQVYNYTVFNKLELLKDYRINSTNLHTALSATTNLKKYNPSDYYEFVSTSLLHVIETMFIKAGLDSPITTISNTLFMLTKKVSNWDDVLETYSNIYFSDLKVDENMLYALAQSLARIAPSTPPEIEASGWDFNVVPTFFDFVSIICSLFGLTLKGSIGADYTLQFLADETYTITDDETYSYDEETFAKDKNIYWQINANARLYYYSSSDVAVTDIFYQTQYDASSEWFNSLMITPADRYFTDDVSNDGTMLAPILFLEGITTKRNYITPDDVMANGENIGDKVKLAYENGYTKLRRKTEIKDEWKNVYQHNIIISQDERKSEITLLS